MKQCAPLQKLMPQCFQQWLRTSHVLPAAKNNTLSSKTTETEFNSVKRTKNSLKDSKRAIKTQRKSKKMHQTGTIFGLDNIFSRQRFDFARCPNDAHDNFIDAQHDAPCFDDAPITVKMLHIYRPFSGCWASSKQGGIVLGIDEIVVGIVWASCEIESLPGENVI